MRTHHCPPESRVDIRAHSRGRTIHGAGQMCGDVCPPSQCHPEQPHGPTQPRGVPTSQSVSRASCKGSLPFSCRDAGLSTHVLQCSLHVSGLRAARDRHTTWCARRLRASLPWALRGGGALSGALPPGAAQGLAVGGGADACSRPCPWGSLPDCSPWHSPHPTPHCALLSHLESSVTHVGAISGRMR